MKLAQDEEVAICEWMSQDTSKGTSGPGLKEHYNYSA